MISSAQNFESEWTGHFSYASVKKITQGNDKIYAASENAVFSYDLTTQELETTSTIQGLSGEVISAIYYSETYALLVIGYENGLIEVVIDGDEDIVSVVDILEKQTISPDRKNINHFYEYEGILYISAGFGISEYDLQALEFGDSFIIGDNGTQIEITQTTVQDIYIYASSVEGGIRRALVASEDLIDFEEWTAIAENNYRGIQSVGDRVYAATNNNVVYEVDSNGIIATVTTYNIPIHDFIAKDDILTITTENSVDSYAQDFQLINSVNGLMEFDYTAQSAYTFNETVYIGTTRLGMLAVPFNNTEALQIIPNGPLFNRGSTIDTSPGQLWMAYGEITVSFNPSPFTQRGISNLREGEWTNIPYEELIAYFGGREATDIVNVSINPEDPEEVYMTSFQQGLIRIQDQTPTNLFDETNSPLEQIILTGGADAGIRLYGSNFDNQGNFWTVQSRTNDALIKISPGGQFDITDISNIIDGSSELALSEIAVGNQGFVFFGAVQSGLVGYDPNGDQFELIGEEEGNGNLPNNSIRALEFDNQGRLWIGTLQGLRVLFNVGGFFEEGANNDAQAIIFEEDGVGQELLFLQSITDIETDGSNNKWISTATSGIFYVSSNGQETIRRFTKENSPLPSNNVQDIAIDGFTGTVYFATINGLVAFKGTSTAPQDDLENVYAFPNPVRPGFEGNVIIDGLTANANVKITDIEGNLVYEETSEGGSIQWDTTAFGRHKVA
ncbi:MAG: ABC transporter substrate-binding protein, partial [Flavobacteriaceae bacterium]|nr:ABC transporter substrate-binding protein [Flavobacteriaceae bacterium]